jgi:prepilin-type N-terminal cleavage/methylation domain-containing protein
LSLKTAKGRKKRQGIMENQVSMLKFKQFLYHRKITIQPNSPRTAAGYTLIELLVVVMLMGIIAAIAAPGWLSFVNQRRVNAANDVIFRALQEAQSQAKNKKLSYSVAFKIPTTPKDFVPQVAVYSTKKPDGNYVDPTNATDLDPKVWRSLGQDLALKPGQVMLKTNVTKENNGDAPLKQDAKYSIITFDYMGNLPPGSKVDPEPLTVTVAEPKGNDPIPSTKRCVKVTTLLGAITIGRGQYDANNNPDGCL